MMVFTLFECAFTEHNIYIFFGNHLALRIVRVSTLRLIILLIAWNKYIHTNPLHLDYTREINRNGKDGLDDEDETDVNKIREKPLFDFAF